jgi:signal transduction histidine kinase
MSELREWALAKLPLGVFSGPQTGSGMLLCAALLLAIGCIAGVVLWLLDLLRTRERLHRLSEQRWSQQYRVARESHDLLLQSIHGLILHFQAAANRIPTDEPARQLLEQALKRADLVLVEARNRVLDL